jgi:hypothetical protein
LFIVNY